MHYFMVDWDRKNNPDRKLKVGDMIVVSDSEHVVWFSSHYEFPKGFYSYRFRVVSLKNSGLSVADNGDLLEVTK